MSHASISERAVEYILSRAFDELKQLTDSTIAEALGVSTAYLCRKFRKDREIKLNDFIVREKIYTAIHILERDTVISIDHLARQLGFWETNSFVHAFKDYIAVEPQRYRELKHLDNPQTA